MLCNKSVSTHRKTMRYGGVGLAFNKARVLILLYALLNASVLHAHIHFVMQQIAVLRTMWAHRPLRTTTSNDKRLCGLCSWSSLKMMGDHHFFNALVQLPATYYVRIKKAKTRTVLARVFAFWWRCGSCRRVRAL